MYTCNVCNYETDNKSNLNHHNKTNKHLTNKEIYNNNTIKENEIAWIKDKEIEELKKKTLI
jgi:hypothetical protein